MVRNSFIIGPCWRHTYVTGCRLPTGFCKRAQDLDAALENANDGARAMSYRGLDVAVEDARLMCVRERARHLAALNVGIT